MRTLRIEGFRAFRSLTLESIGRVNLITGRNNTGKSSILEALRILASGGSPTILADIVQSREEDLAGEEETIWMQEPDEDFPLSSLFHTFPKFSPLIDPIIIAASGQGEGLELKIEANWHFESMLGDGEQGLTGGRTSTIPEEASIPVLVVSAGKSRRLIRLDRTLRPESRSRIFRPDLVDEVRLPCFYASPYSGERTTTLGKLWDSVALSDREPEVIEALRIIDDQISAVSVVGGEGPRRTRRAIVRSKTLSRPVPLRSYGDGLNRLFGVILSLVNAKGGLLLIDEIENGMHHSVQLDVWRTIFKLSKKLNIQVFATSHSWDSIKSFQQAAAEDPEDGVLIRLTRKGEEIIPTLFCEEELEVAASERIEVR